MINKTHSCRSTDVFVLLEVREIKAKHGEETSEYYGPRAMLPIMEQNQIKSADYRLS